MPPQRTLIFSAATAALLIGGGSDRARAQARADTQFVTISIGASRRDLRDYPQNAAAAGLSARLSYEGVVGHRSSWLLDVGFARFADKPVPVSTPRQYPCTGFCVADGWNPLTSTHSSLTVPTTSAEFRRYLVGTVENGLYLGAGGGVALLSMPGQNEARPLLNGHFGYVWRVGRAVGLFAEARYDWLGIDLANETARSPRWLGTPVSVGAALRW